jgi:RHS repeat-associated protein
MAIKDQQIDYVYPDHLGTPRAITDTQNNVVWYWNYDEPFGKTEPNDEVSGTKFSYNLRFPGQYYDQETGLHYNWHRDYDAQTGRYIQSDPIGVAGGINSYGYASNNPLKYIDLYGLKYTDADCRLLADFIKKQWEMYWVYFDRARTGELSGNIQTLTHTALGCDSLYSDEGRRLACKAHENAHKWWHYPVMTPHFYEDSESHIKQVSQFEMMATEVGIKTGEKLYKENCFDCK